MLSSSSGFLPPHSADNLALSDQLQGHPPLAPGVHPTLASCPNPPAPPVHIITRYHGDAQTPDVGLHTVSLLVEFWVYSLRLERRQKKTSDDILGSESLGGGVAGAAK